MLSSRLVILFSDQRISLFIMFHDIGDNLEIRYLCDKHKEGQNGIARNFPPKHSQLIAIGEVAPAVLHERDIEVELDGLDGHEDEAAELEHSCKGGHQDQLVLLEEGLSEVVDLHD